MPQRESRNKPLTLLQIGGVNQRVKATELKPHEYVTLHGVFPEFAGLQSRVWGKRVHNKFANAVYGIHQFWTPYGYGGGLYQFTGTVDFGYWLTPSSDFDLTIPPLGFDAGGMTLDEFGLSYGSNFGYGTTNTCLISFLNGSSDHSSCLPAVSNMGTPDDNNGSPAGKGKSCQWTAGSGAASEYPLINYHIPGQMQQSSIPTNNVELWRKSPPPDPPDPDEPYPIALRPYADFAWVPDNTPNPYLYWSAYRETQVVFNILHQLAAFSYTTQSGRKGKYNFKDLWTPSLITLMIKLEMNWSGVRPNEIQYRSLGIPPQDSNGDRIVTLDAHEYMISNAAQLNGNNGYTEQSAVVSINSVIAIYSNRVCV